MAFSGGVFSRIYNWVSDANNSIPITASRMDAEMDGMATGLSTCLLKDGTQVLTANIPMAGFRLTGLGAGTSANDSVRVAQIQGQSFSYCGTSGGTANAQTLTPTPVITSYAAGQHFTFLPVATNTSGTVTIANSALATRNVKKGIGGAKVILAIGDLIIGTPAEVIDDGTDYILLNPQTYTHGADVASASTIVLDTATGDYVYVTGTTTITAITLSEGRQVTCKFGGILSITAGASLIPPGASNYTTAAGDCITFRGEASGVVRAINYLPAGGIPSAIANGLFNGDASCAQRGTSFTSITGTLRQTLDGWAADSGAGSLMTVSQSAAPAASGFNKVIRVQRPNANTGTDNHRVFQVIETIDCTRFQGQVCTLSFSALAGANFSAASSTLKVQVQTGTGTDEGSAGYNAGSWTGSAAPLNNVSQIITTTLTRYTQTLTIASTSTEIGVGFYFVPVGTAGAADYFDVTGVQLQIGPVTTFEFVPFDRTLAKARRYFQKTFPYATAPAQNVGSVVDCLSVRNPIAAGEPAIDWRFDPPLFKSPTVTTYNPSVANANWRNITAGADVTVEVDTPAVKGSKGILIATSGTVATLGNYLAIHAQAEAAL